jgi:hypothetical protein
VGWGHVCEIRPRGCLDEATRFSTGFLDRAKYNDNISREKLHTSYFPHIGDEINERLHKGLAQLPELALVP